MNGNDFSNVGKLDQEQTILPPIRQKIEGLPFNQLGWEDFERLLQRVLQDIEGLRDVVIYGKPGQAQHGIDIVASTVDQTKVALQSKKYEKFTAAHLRDIVDKFSSVERPFEVESLIIGVACSVRDTKVIDELFRVTEGLKPIKLVFWDGQELSKKLREHPAIVRDFFGEEWAKEFCCPYKLDERLVPTIDVSRFSEALSQTPEVVTKAQLEFEKAKNAATPSVALECIESGQRLLRKAGFSPYAAVYEKERLELLIKLGRSREVIDSLLETFWEAFDRGLLDSANSIVRQAGKWRGEGCDEEWAAHTQEMKLGLELYVDPWNSLPEAEYLRVNGDGRDLRLVVLASEIALANDDYEWLKAALPEISQLLSEPSIDDDLGIRLKLVVAEVNGDWSDLLVDARKLRLGHKISGLIQARYARYCVVQQRFEEADSEWEDSVRSATLAQCWYEANAWVFSRRISRTYWNASEGDLFPLQSTMLAKASTASPMFTFSLKAYEKALEAFENKEYRPAAISAHRALRDAILIGDLGAENRVRLLLAKILENTNTEKYYQITARHYVRTKAIDDIERFGQRVGDNFVDITPDLDATNYWTIGAAYRLLAVQADLIPDDYINVVTDCIIRDFDLADKEELIDLQFSQSSRYNNAVRCLAEIANRVELRHATRIVRHFKSQPILEDDYYRFHDDNESVALAKIALQFKELAGDIIPYLIHLLKRSSTSRRSVAHRAITEYAEISCQLLRQLAESKNEWANEMLVRLNMSDISTDVAQTAFKRLSEPLEHELGRYTIGTRAIEDSLLIRNFPSSDVDNVVSELISRANDPKVSYRDRADYLLAVVNLSEEVSQSRKGEYYEAVVQLIKSPNLSEYDSLEQQFRNPLGFLRMKEQKRTDLGAAALVAAKFADSDNQKAEVKRLIYSLLIQGHEKWLAEALYSIRDVVFEDLGFLMGKDWEMRTLVAYLWAENNGVKHIGDFLASDPDYRVRHSLAASIRDKPREQFIEIFEKLEVDPRFSVRSALKK